MAEEEVVSEEGEGGVAEAGSREAVGPKVEEARQWARRPELLPLQSLPLLGR